MSRKMNLACVVIFLLGSASSVLAANNDITPSNDQGTPSGHYPVADPSIGFACKTMWCGHLFVEIATVMTTISSLGRPPALSKRNPSFSTKAIASVAQSEASSITAHGGGATLQDCMGLWDAATHMSKQEWKAACMRSMVVEFPYGSR
jgi:hypothetical protein